MVLDFFAVFLAGLAKMRSQFLENSGEAPERIMGPLIDQPAAFEHLGNLRKQPILGSANKRRQALVRNEDAAPGGLDRTALNRAEGNQVVRNTARTGLASNPTSRSGSAISS